jgi:hypothetical protein
MTRATTTAPERAAAAQRTLAVRPVTSDNWPDFVRLFESNGGPHHCWCTAYRVRDSRSLGRAEKKSHMDALVHDATPIGVLAYLGEEPVGWCSVAPRETYVRLERSRTIPRVSSPATSTWTLLCLFVSRSRRRREGGRKALGRVSRTRWGVDITPKLRVTARLDAWTP